MDDGDGRRAGSAHRPGPRLRRALRRARRDNAERSDVLADLAGAERARLEILFDALEPLRAEIPAEIDLFDMAIMPGSRPRLFVDMIAFVEMGHDRRLYRLVQDTRFGRTVLAENERVEAMVDAVTDYVARRLVERDMALAAAEASFDDVAPLDGASPSRRSVPFMLVRRLSEVLGAALLFALVGLGAWHACLAAIAWFDP